MTELVIRSFFLLIIAVLFGYYLVIIFAARRAYRLTKIVLSPFWRTTLYINLIIIFAAAILIMLI